MDRSDPDLVVLGGGPAGLGAALAAAREGARVVLVEAAPRVGGLCVTRGRDGVRYDLGGHIPFVRDAAREAWLRDLLGDDLVWVPRPVASLRDGRVRPGRYLDQRPGPGGAAPDAEAPPDASASEVLAAMFGRAFVDLEMRAYLEKIDGVPLERIPGTRPLRLMRDQAAPRGFWFPAEGIGSLMEAMRAAVEAAGGRVLLGTRVQAIGTAGGRVVHVDVEGPAGRRRIPTGRLVVAVPAGLAAGLLDVPGPRAAAVDMRAVCLVFAAVDGPTLTGEAWVQVDDPRVPFARVMEVGNWSPRMAPAGTVVLGMECYCRADDDDPVWRLDDAALLGACARALAEPLGWLDDPARVRPLEVVRLSRAYPLPDVAQLPAVARAGEALAAVAGVQVAPGADVIAAIDAGEAAATAALSGPARAD